MLVQNSHTDGGGKTKISVDTHILKNNCKDIEIELDNIDANINSIKNIVNEIGNKWQGADYDYFTENMTNFYKSLYDIKDSTSSYVDFIYGYLKVIDKLELYYSNAKIDLK